MAANEHGGVTYQTNSKFNCNRKQLLVVVSDDSLKARVQGFQLSLIAKFEKVWAKVSIYNTWKGVAFGTLYEFADLWGNNIADWMRDIRGAQRARSGH